MWQEAVALKRPRPRTFTTPVCVMFDLDGTLVDTMQTFADVAADVMAETHGLDREASREAYLETSGIPFFQQLELIVPGDPRNAQASAAFELRKVVATANVMPNESTVVALRRLRMRGIHLVVSSNNFQDQVDKFVGGCSAEFDLALGFGGGLAKGEPHFERACAHFGCARDHLLFVGDSLADAALAMAGGVRFVGRAGTFSADELWRAAPEGAVIDEIDELLTLFA